MKNKNLIYVALGLGAGIFAYYYFCRKKYVASVGEGNLTDGGQLANENEGGDDKPVVSISNPTGRELAPPPINPVSVIREIITPTSTLSSTPITTTASNTTANPVTSTISPVIAPISPSSSTSVTTPVSKPATMPISTSVDKPLAISIEKPALTTEPISKEISIAPTRTLTTDLKTSEPLKVGFDGVGQLCFEVGECLNDL